PTPRRSRMPRRRPSPRSSAPRSSARRDGALASFGGRSWLVPPREGWLEIGCVHGMGARDERLVLGRGVVPVEEREDVLVEYLEATDDLVAEAAGDLERVALRGAER